MLLKKEKEVKKDEVNIKKVNEIIDLSSFILKVSIILLIIVGVYAAIKLIGVLNIMPFIRTLLRIISPLFIGLIFAWLFDPIVSKLQKKGIKRGLGTTIVYVVFIGIIIIILYSIIPLLTDQITDFAKMIPNIISTVEGWIDSIFDKFANIEGFDADATKLQIIAKVQEFGTNMAQNLPEITVNLVRSFFSFMGTFLVGLIIGFYFLVGFENVHAALSFIPKKIRKDTILILDDANESLRNFVRGAVIDSTLIFVVQSILFWITGLKAPLLFGLFCGITNVIPYAGPYIGGIPAIIVAFSQSPSIGIFTLIAVVSVQFIEGNFLQPLIMSKSTKLHPVTIMLGLLVFGYFWGVIGMVVSTPLIAVAKTVFMYFDNKYDFFRLKHRKEVEVE